MPKQIGNIHFEGTMGDLIFYKSRGVFLVRAKNRVSRERILHDPKFARLRENGSEFGMAVKAGKLLRDTVRPMYKGAGTRRSSARLLQLMMNVIKLDTISKRGERNASVALAAAMAKKMLKGFEFNEEASMGYILQKNFTLEMATGSIVITDLLPERDVRWPEGATHVTLRSGIARTDFGSGENALTYSAAANIAKVAGVSTITLTPAGMPAGSGIKCFLLQAEFFQMVNGVAYVLNNEMFNGMVIAGVE